MRPRTNFFKYNRGLAKMEMIIKANPPASAWEVTAENPGNRWDTLGEVSLAVLLSLCMFSVSISSPYYFIVPPADVVMFRLMRCRL